MEKDDEKVNLDKQNDNQSSSEAAAIIFILFFIGEIIAIAIFSQIKPILCASCFGLLLLVIGISGLKEKQNFWNSLPILVISIIGLLLMALPIADIISRKKTGETFFTIDNLTIVVTSFFGILGLLSIFLPFVYRHSMLKKCTEKVTATCISLDRHRMHRSQTSHRHSYGSSRSRNVYAPEWEYYFNGTVYHRQEQVHVNMFVPRVGETREIYVNPDNPEEFYRHNPGVLATSIPMGIIMIAICLLTVYFVFFAA